MTLYPSNVPSNCGYGRSKLIAGSCGSEYLEDGTLKIEPEPENKFANGLSIKLFSERCYFAFSLMRQ